MTVTRRRGAPATAPTTGPSGVDDRPRPPAGSTRRWSWWHRLVDAVGADLRLPTTPIERSELPFLLLSSVGIVITAQRIDPGTTGEILVVAAGAGAFLILALAPRVPAELVALAVVVPIVLATGQRGDLELAFFLVVLLALYTAWHIGSLIRASAIAALATAGPLVTAAVLAPDESIQWVPWSSACLFTFSLGRTLQRQRGLIAELEAARQALADQAVADERRRIARELHDLAGHTLAAMLLHVTGARHVLRRDPDDAEQALRDAESVGRASLDQIRVTVTALRTTEAGTDAPLAGSADLGPLVEEYRRAGLAVDARIDPDTARIEGPVATAVHRICREALSNVARHAPHNRVELAVELDDAAGRVRLAVVDGGRPPLPPDTGVHYGLTGMTERARALGGDLRAGPTGDGWAVEATIPVGPLAPGEVASS